MPAAKKQSRIRSAYGNNLPRVTVKFTKPSLTEQHHARSCDINTIMARYQKTGVIEHIKRHKSTYGDVSQLDFQEAMQTVARAKSEFEELPAYARDAFKGGVEEYLHRMSQDDAIEHLQSILHPTDKYNADGSPAGTNSDPAEPGSDGTDQDRDGDNE
jgi:hypothetical protein